MLEKKVLFEYDSSRNDLLEDSELISSFWDIVFREVFGRKHNLVDKELFVKVGSLHKPVSFEFNVSYVPENSKERIYKIDDVRFVADALIATKNHKVIDDNVYRKLNDTKIEEGEYLVAICGTPFFELKREKSAWAYKPMTFNYYGQEGFFKHAIDFDGRHSQISLELKIVSKRENNFLDLYKTVLKYYIKQDFKIIEPKANKKK